MVQNTDTKVNRRRLMSEVLVGDSEQPQTAEKTAKRAYKTPIKTQQLTIDDEQLENNNN